MIINEPLRPLLGDLLVIAFGFFFTSLTIVIACGFTIEFDGFAIAMRIFLLLSGIAYVLRDYPVLGKISWAMAGIIAYSLISAGGVMLSFSAAIACWPLQDALMSDIDRYLGYDWRAYGELVSSSSTLRDTLKLSYDSIAIQPIFIIIAISVHSDYERIIAYVITTSLALIFTVSIFMIIPVTTAWSHGTAIDISDAARLSMNDGWSHELERLRNGSLRNISWGIVGAVIGFPSFHCISSVVNTWIVRGYRGFRHCVIFTNFFLILSTPVFGGHYMIDLIAGVIVAVASIFFAQVATSAIVRGKLVRSKSRDTSELLTPV